MNKTEKIKLQYDEYEKAVFEELNKQLEIFGATRLYIQKPKMPLRPKTIKLYVDEKRKMKHTTLFEMGEALDV